MRNTSRKTQEAQKKPPQILKRSVNSNNYQALQPQVLQSSFSGSKFPTASTLQLRSVVNGQYPPEYLAAPPFTSFIFCSSKIFVSFFSSIVVLLTCYFGFSLPDIIRRIADMPRLSFHSSCVCQRFCGMRLRDKTALNLVHMQRHTAAQRYSTDTSCRTGPCLSSYSLTRSIFTIEPARRRSLLKLPLRI